MVVDLKRKTWFAWRISQKSGKGERCHFFDSPSGFPVAVCMTDAMDRLMCKEKQGTRKSYFKTH